MSFNSKNIRYLLLYVATLSGVSIAGSSKDFSSSQLKNNVYSAKYADIASQQILSGNVCGTDQNQQNWQLIQKENKQQLADPKSFANQLLKQISTQKQSLTSAKVAGSGEPGRYYIPVVFHVYGSHFNCDNGGTCLTDQKIIEGLNLTNEDFRGLNSQDGPIAAEFQAIRENLDIEFVLAKKDPNGNTTNGIVRYANDQAGYGDDAAYSDKIKQDAWDNFKYMNVYIMRDLYADGDTNNSGVAWYPQLSMSQAGTARVVYNGNYLGTNTSENFRSVLTHEFGHWLNLPHVFDGDVCSVHQEAFCAATGDSVCDTPQMSSSILQNNTPNCLGKPTNTENFMHYSDNYAMFTQQQVQRMTAALHSPSRATLWTNNNLIATGLDELTSDADHPWDGSGGDSKPQGTVIQEFTNLSAQKGDADDFSINLPAGIQAVAFYLDGFLEDPDLYVTKGAAPYKNGDTWVADYISFRSSGSPELVTLTSPSSNQTYHATVDAFSAYSNATLQVISASDPTLCDGCERIILHEEKGLSATKGDAVKTYQFNVPVDAIKTVAVLSGGYQGDPDMYVSIDSIPDSNTFDCGPFSAPRLSEYCEFAKGGEVNIMIEPFLDYSEASLYVYYEREADSGLPIAEANGPYSTNLGNAIAFSSAGSIDNDGSIVSYAWDFGDGNTSDIASPQHIYATSGSFIATLTVTDNAGYTATDTANVTITQSNQAPVAQANGPYVGNKDQLINFSSSGSTDPDGRIDSYFWNFGDGQSSNQANPQHVYSATGSYVAVLTVTDDQGATSSVNADVTISGTEYCAASGNTGYEWIAKVVSNQFEHASSAEGYADNSGLIIPLTAGDNSFSLTAGGNYSEKWAAWIDFNQDGIFNNTDEKVISGISGKGTINASVVIPANTQNMTTRMRIVMKYGSEATTACGSMGDGEIEDYSVSISQSANLPPQADINGPYSGTVNSNIQFSSQGSSDADGSIENYLWSFGDGQSSTEANPSHSYSTPGEYSVTLTVTDNAGATDVKTTQVNIIDDTTNPNLPNACLTQSPITGGRLEAGQVACLGSQNTIWLSLGNVNQHQSVAITTGHGQGNLDILYRNGGWPSETNFDAQSNGSGNTECIYLNAGSQYWSYLKISGNATGASIVVDFDSPACR